MLPLARAPSSVTRRSHSVLSYVRSCAHVHVLLIFTALHCSIYPIHASSDHRAAKHLPVIEQRRHPDRPESVYLGA